MNNVTVYLEVYNEEKRLENCLKDFMWADEIVVFVKRSTDNTFEIAKKFTPYVFEVPHCEGSENICDNINMHLGKKWFLFCTASSKMDEELVPFIINLTSDETFDYDVIGLPYLMTVFGISGNSSPWGSEYKYSLIRKTSLVLSNRIHREISWHGKKIYKIDKKLTTGRFKHNTHENPDSFFYRHLRYTKAESSQYIMIYKEKAFIFAFYEFIKSIGFVFLKKRSIFFGRDGLVLSFAYISYFLMRLIFIWFNQRNK